MPQYEHLGFELVKARLLEIGYPEQIRDFQYKPGFPVGGAPMGVGVEVVVV